MKTKEIEIGSLIKRLKYKDVFLLTTVIYIAIVLLYELFYCNFRFFTGVIENYNFSLYRIIAYCTVYFIYYKFKDKFINNAIETLNSKVKCYFIDIVIFSTILLSASLIFIAIQKLTINIIIGFILLLVFNLFALYISNNIVKNAIITALLFGSIFSISVTFNNQLDEKRHFLSSYSVAIGELNLKEPKVDVGVANMPRMMQTTQFVEYFEQKPTGENTEDFSNKRLEDTPNNYMVVSYLVSGFGIFISKILGRKYCRHIHNRKSI